VAARLPDFVSTVEARCLMTAFIVPNVDPGYSAGGMAGI